MPRRMAGVTCCWVSDNNLMAKTGSTQGMRLSSKPPMNAPNKALSKAQLDAGFAAVIENAVGVLALVATGGAVLVSAGHGPSIFKPTRQLCSPASSTSNRFSAVGSLWRNACSGACICQTSPCQLPCTAEPARPKPLASTSGVSAKANRGRSFKRAGKPLICSDKPVSLTCAV